MLYDILLCIFGYNNEVANGEMFKELSHLVNEWKVIYEIENVIMGGEFNISPDLWLAHKSGRLRLFIIDL